jgi:hypothetical protein
MARTLFLLALAVVSCRNTGGDRDVGSAPRGFDTPRRLRGEPRPDDPNLPVEEQQRRGRARYGVYEDDPRVQPNGLIDRYGPTGR